MTIERRLRGLGIVCDRGDCEMCEVFPGGLEEVMKRAAAAGWHVDLEHGDGADRCPEHAKERDTLGEGLKRMATENA